MPHIDLVTCQLCYGSRRIITATSGEDGIAGTIKPCSCASKIEAITNDGEVIPIKYLCMEFDKPTKKALPTGWRF